MDTLPRTAVVAGYTDTGRLGIELWVDDEGDGGGWSLRAPGACAQPSWLVDLGGGCLLAVGESEPSTLSRVTIDPESARVDVDHTLPLSGSAACHAAVAGRYAVVAHYGSGSVSSVWLDDDGRPLAETDHVVLRGHGPDPERQDAPHAHQVVIDGEEILVCDLGTDRVHRLRLDEHGRLHESRRPVELPPGFGPRHLVRVGEDLLVVAGELSNELWLGRVHGDDVSMLDLVSLGEASPSFPSALRADSEGLLWTGVRGPDTVAVHRLEGARLRPVAECSTGGRWPRDVVVDRDEVWVTNQLSDNVTVLSRTAVLAGAADAVRTRLTSPAPTCVVLPATH